MAIEGWQGASVFANGSCIHEEEVIKMICNLDALNADSARSMNRVTCKPLDFSLSSSGGEVCHTVESNFRDVNPLSEDGQAIDKKIVFLRISGDADFLINVSGDDNDANDANGGNGAQLSQTASIKIVCTNNDPDEPVEEVITTSISALNSGQLLPFNCKRTDDIMICMEGRFDVQLCGGIICVASRSLLDERRNGLYCLPKPDGCCVDRMALYLAEQNAADICFRYLNSGDQFVECFDTQLNGLGTQTIATAGADGTFISFGQINFCTELQNMSGDENKRDEFIHINANIGCAGGESINCRSSVVVKGDVSGISFGEQCFSIPIVSCGRCKEGDVIQINSDAGRDCSEIVEPIINRPVEAEGDICTWFFSEAKPEDLLSFVSASFVDCIDGDELTKLSDKITALHDYACEREDVNCSSFNGRTVVSTGGAAPATGILVAPNTNPPNPIPSRKLFCQVDVEFCIEDSGFGSPEDADSVAGLFTLECGGEVREYVFKWIYKNSGQVFLCGDNTYLAGCFSCLVTEPVQVSIQQITGPTVTATVNHSCISF